MREELSADGVVVDEQGDLVFPGFVNAHSHAFQRALRGRVEHRAAAGADGGADGGAVDDDFWSWRTAMYSDAARLTPDDVEALAAWCYADMLCAGYTSVGEFHYLHHDVDGAPFAQPEMSMALARAAMRVGIRLVLLETAYARGGVDKPLSPTQRRFAFATPDRWAQHVDKVRAWVDTLDNVAGAAVAVGVAVHSVRACPRELIDAVAGYGARYDLQIHVHACEQRREIDECRFEHGLSPIALLDDCAALSSSTTIVHATHVEQTDIERIAERQATVCVTPSTERNLGDGLCPISSLWQHGVPVCIGSDSHARIDVVDELRSLEDHERLRTERRNVLLAPGKRLADALLPCGTVHGNGALGLDDVADDSPLSPRNDRVVVRMPIEGRGGDARAGRDAWLVGGSSRDVRTVHVGGRVVVDEGRLVSADQRAIEERALAVLKRLASV